VDGAVGGEVAVYEGVKEVGVDGIVHVVVHALGNWLVCLLERFGEGNYSLSDLQVLFSKRFWLL